MAFKNIKSLNNCSLNLVRREDKIRPAQEKTRSMEDLNENGYSFGRRFEI
jgi:hypothetical protein